MRKILPFFIALIIVSFSLAPGVVSSHQSGIIVDMLKHIAILSGVSTKVLTLIVRKAAHLTEYAIFGAGTFLAWRNFSDMKHCEEVVIIASFVLAAIDEITQLGVEGRLGSFTDVLIDTTGAMIGVAIAMAIYQRKTKNHLGL